MAVSGENLKTHLDRCRQRPGPTFIFGGYLTWVDTGSINCPTLLLGLAKKLKRTTIIIINRRIISGFGRFFLSAFLCAFSAFRVSRTVAFKWQTVVSNNVLDLSITS